MASSPFCQFLKHLFDILPALSAKQLPTLYAFALLGKEFKLQETESPMVDLAKASEAVSSPKKADSKPVTNGVTPPQNKDQASPCRTALL